MKKQTDAPNRRVGKIYETISQAAERLTLSTRTLRGLIQSGRIPAYRVGKRRIALDPSEVDKAIGAKMRPAK